jgi:glucan 1,4-alpha-glucosidase
MNYISKIILLCIVCASANAQTYRMKSPNGNQVLTFMIDESGAPTYSLNFKGKAIIKPSAMGFQLKEANAMQQNFQVWAVDSTSKNETWLPIWGEEKEIRNNYKELRVTVRQRDKENRMMMITFRVFDDGLGFKYDFPTQKNMFHFIIADEKTQFNLAGNHKIWWLPGDYDTNEYPPRESDMSDIPNYKSTGDDEIFAKTPITKPSVQTPLMLKTTEGLYINIHEAGLRNYSAMNLVYNNNNGFESTLVPDAVGNMTYMIAPCATPWRTIIVSDKATDILASRTILNLNEPSKAGDKAASWIKPMKYIGIWWEMHVGRKTWDYAGSQVASQNGENKANKSKHGATTAHAKEYIDFAAQHGFGGVLIEGWNTGWEDWFGKWKEDVFDFTTAYPDFDVQEVNRYAKSKGITIVTHLETSGSITNFERYADTAFRQMKRFGSDACKTGYVGKIIPRGEHHDGQWMIKHYERIAAKTLDYKVMLVSHEAVRPTGLHRTYPNWMACESARGNEFNAWSQGNKPFHETVLPFTRLMGGPMDYTPGIFKIKMNYYYPDSKNQVHTTLTKQMALYITMYSPVQMAADLIENYKDKMDAFQFIKDVAVDWDKTVYLAAEPGDYVMIARQQKNSSNWFVGATNDENARELTVDFSFLTKGKKYKAIMYMDGKDASWDKNPESYQIVSQTVTSDSKVTLKLASGGGTAISIMEVK